MERFVGEIKEKFRIPLYTGDTMENFITCAVEDRGSIFYDKSRLPERAYPTLFVDKTDMSFPLYRAITKAKKLGHSPVIIEGNISRFSPHFKGSKEWIEFPQGFLLPVQKIWTIRSNIDWKHLLDQETDPNIQELLLPQSPRSVLVANRQN